MTKSIRPENPNKCVCASKLQKEQSFHDLVGVGLDKKRMLGGNSQDRRLKLLASKTNK